MMQNNLCMEIPNPDYYIDAILYSEDISKFMSSLSRNAILLDEPIGEYDYKLQVSLHKVLYLYNNLTDYQKNLIKLHSNIKILRVLEVDPVAVERLDSSEVCSIRVMHIWKI